MNVLLVMPKTGYMWDKWATPPIGVAYISAYLKKHNVNVFNLNLNVEDGSLYEILKRYIKDYNIEILGVGELVVNYDKIQEIVFNARKIKPNLRIWIGGGFVTNSPKEAMELVPEADYGMIGEGEITSLELIQMLEEKSNNYSLEDIKKVKGLIVRDEAGKLVFTEKRDDIMELDALPFPDWEGFQLVDTLQKYQSNIQGITAPVVSSRSCPNACTFCSTFEGKKYRKRSLDNIFAEIDLLVSNFHVVRIKFMDELFADSSKNLYEFCERIKKYNIEYHVSMHIGKNLTYDLLKEMHDSGCQVIFYGLESADDNVLKSMRKHISIAEMKRCLVDTKRAGIVAEGNFIFGDVVETKKSVEKTIKWIENNNTLGHFEVAPIKLFPGSQLYFDAVRNGKIKDTVEFIKDKCPLINVSSLTDQEYRHMIDYDLTIVQKMRRQRQKNVRLSMDNNSCSVEYVCPSCKEKIYFNIEDKSQLLRQYTHHCDKCGTLEYLNLSSVYYDLIKDKLESMLMNRKVAIFGCGNIWKMFYELGDVFQKDNYIIVDETPYLQQNGWNGKMVYSPDKLKEKKIDTIIMMLRTSKQEMKEKVNEQYGFNDIDIKMIYDIV